MAKTVALITGANQGLGLAIARRLATEHKDYAVVMAGRRKDAVEAAAQALQKDGLAVEPLVLDVTSDASIAAAVQAVEAQHGRLDVLVNNAALGGAAGAGTRAEWAQLLDTNVASVAAVTDAFLPLLTASVGSNGPKRIVFMSSSLGSLAYKADPAQPTHANVARAYTTSKAALNMLAWHYMVDFEGDAANWKINCNCPGFCGTQLNGFQGTDTVENGARNAVRLATLGPDGETATFSNRHGPVPW